ncbi:MAG: hypothetical protein U0457_06685 [Candidatus Sericytochromatia bacterium]
MCITTRRAGTGPLVLPNDNSNNINNNNNTNSVNNVSNTPSSTSSNEPTSISIDDNTKGVNSSVTNTKEFEKKAVFPNKSNSTSLDDINNKTGLILDKISKLPDDLKLSPENKKDLDSIKEALSSKDPQKSKEAMEKLKGILYSAIKDNPNKEGLLSEIYDSNNDSIESIKNYKSPEAINGEIAENADNTIKTTKAEITYLQDMAANSVPTPILGISLSSKEELVSTSERIKRGAIAGKVDQSDLAYSTILKAGDFIFNKGLKNNQIVNGAVNQKEFLLLIKTACDELGKGEKFSKVNATFLQQINKFGLDKETVNEIINSMSNIDKNKFSDVSNKISENILKPNKDFNAAIIKELKDNKIEFKNEPNKNELEQLQLLSKVTNSDKCKDTMLKSNLQKKAIEYLEKNPPSNNTFKDRFETLFNKGTNNNDAIKLLVGDPTDIMNVRNNFISNEIQKIEDEKEEFERTKLKNIDGKYDEKGNEVPQEEQVGIVTDTEGSQGELSADSKDVNQISRGADGSVQVSNNQNQMANFLSKLRKIITDTEKELGKIKSSVKAKTKLDKDNSNRINDFGGYLKMLDSNMSNTIKNELKSIFGEFLKQASPELRANKKELVKEFIKEAQLSKEQTELLQQLLKTNNIAA